VVLALVVARLLTTLLYGVNATDVVSFAVALALVMTMVLVASLIPAWGASRTDPIVALRHR
jgi:ABC-type lipoprotein release transport system permease subunit